MLMVDITYVFSMAGLTGNTNLVSSSIQYVISLPGCAKFERSLTW
jgi:hypothetical protein